MAAYFIHVCLHTSLCKWMYELFFTCICFIGIKKVAPFLFYHLQCIHFSFILQRRREAVHKTAPLSSFSPFQRPCLSAISYRTYTSCSGRHPLLRFESFLTEERKRRDYCACVCGCIQAMCAWWDKEYWRIIVVCVFIWADVHIQYCVIGRKCVYSCVQGFQPSLSNVGSEYTAVC